MAFEVISYEIPSLHLPICKFLYKQKLFQQVLSSIISKIETLSEAHLSALVFVFKIAPHKVLQMNIEVVSYWNFFLPNIKFFNGFFLGWKNTD